VLLIPLIGALDSQRAQQVIEAVLEGVTSYQATTVLLDISGVPLVDTQVANSLLQTNRTAASVHSADPRRCGASAVE
jgi:rsbT co-antagonist protein RsbR